MRTEYINIYISIYNVCIYTLYFLCIYIIYIYRIFFIYSSSDGHLGCFYILAVVNNVAINMGVHIFSQANVFIFLG